MGVEPQQLHPKTVALIKRKAKQLVGRYGFRRDDVQDIQQDLAGYVVAGQHRYDPSRSSQATFESRIVHSKVPTIIKHANALRRDRSRVSHFDEDPDLENQRSTDPISHQNLVIDVATALSTLPSNLCHLAILMKDLTESELIRQTGRTRQQIRTARKKIARHFLQCGLGPESLNRTTKSASDSVDNYWARSQSEHRKDIIMRKKQTQFIFKPAVCMREVRDTLAISCMASEILHGAERVALDAKWKLRRKRHRVSISTDSAVGKTLALIFLGFVRREFGSHSFRVVRDEPALAKTREAA